MPTKDEYEQIIEQMLRCENSNLCEDCREEALEVIGGKKEYVSVPIEVDDNSLLKLCIMAHEENITLNKLCEKILTQQMKNSNIDDDCEKNCNNPVGFNEAATALRDGKRVYFKDTESDSLIWCSEMTEIIKTEEESMLIRDKVDEFKFYIAE